MDVVSRPTARNVWAAALAGLLFVESWFLYFHNWQGSFAGLTDDHYFYLVRGWQILYGDLPVRDFVDHGAPLFYSSVRRSRCCSGAARSAKSRSRPQCWR
jgi:hypothetical protein